MGLGGHPKCECLIMPGTQQVERIGYCWDQRSDQKVFKRLCRLSREQCAIITNKRA